MTNQTKIRDFLKQLAKEKGYENEVKIDIQPLPGSSFNTYTADVSAPLKVNLHLFIKAVDLHDGLQDGDIVFEVGFEIERYFYADIAVAFRNIYNKLGVRESNRIYIPKHFALQSDTLVFENLQAKDYATLSPLNTFNWDYASNAIVELAKFHAIGIAFIMDNKDKLDQINRKLTNNWLATEKVRNIFKTQALKIGREVKEEYRMKLRKYLEENNLVDDMVELWSTRESGFLVHGEYRPANIMFRNHDGKVEIVPIDYQTCRLGSLTIDLMYFIWFGSDERFRKDNYEILIELYYDQLTEALLNLSIDINNVYPRDKFENELAENKYLGLFIGLTMMSFTFTTAEHHQGTRAFEKIEDLLREPSARALDRINGIVGDYIRRGFI